MTISANPAIADAMRSVTAAIPRAAADPTRPGYHFCPPALWMNDPNGPIFHKGWLHLFYQHNPYGDDWGHMHWGHTRSHDLVHWEHLPIALWPSLDLGEEHVFSGCAWRDGRGEPLLFYTSVKRGPKESRPNNEQWAARPLDDELIVWEKHPANPILALETHGGPAFDREWRDPFIFEEAGRTFLVIGGDFGETAGVGLYEAFDDSLTRWRYCGLLVQEAKTKIRFFECPNFVKIGRQWILLTSPYKPIEYMTGTFDVDTLTFTPQRQGVLDAGFAEVPNFYASNIVFDAAGRCLLLGWVRGFAKGRGWNGCLALPRILTIDEEGYPRQAPIPELQQLRGKQWSFRDLVVENEILHLPEVAGNRLEIVLTVELNGAEEAGLMLRSDANSDGVAIRCSGTTLVVAGTKVDLPTAQIQALDLHIFLDNSVLEVFACDGRIAVTRVLDLQPGGDGVALFSRGRTSIRTLDVWEVATV